MQQHRSSEERREHWQEVHRQRVRLIRRQESDDRHYQSLGLAEWSAQQRVKMQLDSHEALYMEYHVCTSR